MEVLLFSLVIIASIWFVLLKYLNKQMMELKLEDSKHDAKFKPGFKFGASTASYQIEEGTPPSNWKMWEETKRKDGTSMCPPANDKVKSIEKFEDDIAALKTIGASIYRFSISWARVNPTKGIIDRNAINMYKNWILRLKDEGIEPLVTLWHFETPLWVEEDGGTHGKNFVHNFMEYAKAVIDELGDQVNLWHTTNEPVGYVVSAYVAGIHPPGYKGFSAIKTSYQNLFEVHAKTYHLIHSKNPNAKVSFAKNVVPFVPMHKWSLLEHIIAYIGNYYTRSAMRCFEEGCLRFLWRKKYIEGLKDSLDFISINHYYCVFVSVDPRNWSKMGGKRVPLITLGDRFLKTSDFGWGLLSTSLGCVVEWINKLHNPKKLHFAITENGIADRSDELRQWFMVSTLKYLSEVSEKIDIDFYTHWCLTDNYEWAEGFEMKFGLFEVEEGTYNRIPRKSASLFREVVDHNR